MTSKREGGALVSKVHQLSGRAFARILKAHGLDELNPAQGRILYALWREDQISQAELAARTKLEKSTLTLMLDRLEKQGQIERRPDPSDARRRLVCTTEKNRALHGAYEAASAEMLERFYRNIEETEIGAFERTLKKILANLEEAIGSS